jgi:hypothetical protein
MITVSICLICISIIFLSIIINDLRKQTWELTRKVNKLLYNKKEK